MRLTLIWTGAVMSAYRLMFLELSRHCELTVIGPREWVHGSIKAAAEQIEESRYKLIITRFIPANSSKYLIPSLPCHIIRSRPTHVLIIDELDRVNMCVHLLIIKMLRPGAQTAVYCAQNLCKPAYYRWYHFLALKLNSQLINKAIAASHDTRNVLKHHGYSGPCGVIPLSISLDFFAPGAKVTLHDKHNLPHDKTILIYSGSLAKGKGIELLISVISRFPNLFLIIAGQGPLAGQVQRAHLHHVKYFGPVKQEFLRELYQLSDYVILPSYQLPSWKEQIGRALLEGVACGCVALGSDSGYIPNIILEPNAIFKEKDPESLKSLLASLPLSNHNEIYKRQHDNVQRNYSVQVVCDNTIKFLRSNSL